MTASCILEWLKAIGPVAVALAVLIATCWFYRWQIRLAKQKLRHDLSHKRHPQSGKHGDQRLGNLVGIDRRMRIGRFDLAQSCRDHQQAVRIFGHLPQASDKHRPLDSEGAHQIREILALDNADVLKSRNRVVAQLQCPTFHSTEPAVKGGVKPDHWGGVKVDQLSMEKI